MILLVTTRHSGSFVIGQAIENQSFGQFCASSCDNAVTKVKRKVERGGDICKLSKDTERKKGRKNENKKEKG